MHIYAVRCASTYIQYMWRYCNVILSGLCDICSNMYQTYLKVYRYLLSIDTVWRNALCLMC